MSTSALPPPGVTVCRCYLRVSKKDQRPEIQRVQHQKFCADRGWWPVFYEEKIKGSRTDRPEFIRASADAVAGQALGINPQAFLVTMLDRFGREQVYMLTQLQVLETRGVITASLAEPWLEGDDDSRPILLGVTSGMAASELKRLRRRTEAAQSFARAQGKHIGRPFKPLASLLEAKRLTVAEGLSLREAVARVNASAKDPKHRISPAVLSRFLRGTWKGERAELGPEKAPEGVS